jgi:UDP-2,4-diacetamido-2,4,6-trideoxy-beta-L-altropyranose hydrolase
MDAVSRVAFRVDASRLIGTGHLMRCLTLADAFRQRHGTATFVSRHMPGYLRAMIVRHGHEFLPLEHADSQGTMGDLPHSKWLGTSEAADADAALRAVGSRAWDLLVVDHYALGARFETAFRGISKRILVIDDLADRKHDCDTLLDQNDCAAGDGRYAGKVPEHCRLLLGPRYALLREEFRKLHEQVGARTGVVRRVLVFMGGMDAGNHTARAIEALSRTGRSDLEVDVVIGEEHPHRGQIESACALQGYRCHVQVSGMAQLVARADLAIGSGGSAAWERCCLGLPALTLCVAENQRRLIEGAALNGLLYAASMEAGRAGALVHHLNALFDNPILLRSMSANGLRSVDGRGVDRVLRALGCGSVVIREAAQSDSANILSWRNDPAARAVSRNKDAIDQATHDAWFRSVLDDPDRMLLIGEQGGEPVGVVRFDIAGGESRVSIFLAPGLSGRGLGGDLLAAAEGWLVERRRDVKAVLAEVLDDNDPSHALFRAGGYRPHLTLYMKGLDRK